MSNDVLMHYGRSKKDGAIVGSGRYPLGSGDDPYQHEEGFNEAVRKLLKTVNPETGKNYTEREVAQYYDIVDAKGNPSVVKLRAKVSIAKNEDMAAKQAYAVRMKEHGYSQSEIARRMGVNESNVRSYLKAYEQHKTDVLTNISNTLKENIDKDNRYIDISPGTEIDMGTTRTKLNTAIAMLEEQGYKKVVVQVPQMGLHPNQKTYITTLCPPGTEYKDVVHNMTNIKTMDDRFVDHGESTADKLHYPEELSSKRIMIRYAEEGGSEKDGVIEIRRGVKDLDLGEKQYGQVRINVDGTHYLKGMAMYAEDESKMPKGVDVIFNTNKHVGTPGINPDPEGKEVFKKLSPDPLNPFGANIKPGGQRGVINLCKEEGDWDKQRDRLASQFLSKQPPALAKKQLKLAESIKEDEFAEIMSLTNPAIKKKMLKDFADSCDAAAVELHAAALPRQSWKVILPITDLKENEIYAPTYKHGEEVVLIRYPHGGIFEIPTLIVNNRQETANKVMKNATDAVGINAKVAERLSGADFDGDTVLVIPTKSAKIKTRSPLTDLKDFDPKVAYPGYAGMKKLSAQQKQIEMGKVTNLINDMTIIGADWDEIARAVKHSMVIIDAEKHGLNYKQSEIDNGIKQLKEKYQNGGGVQTLISRAKSVEYVPARKMAYKIDEKTGKKIWEPIKDGTYKEVKKTIDPETGKKVYEFTTDPETGAKVPVYTGKEKQRLTKSSRMAEADTPEKVRALSSGTVIENIYADYAINMKELANKARLEYVNTPNLEYNPSAKKAYAKEVESLNAKLLIAQKNAPRERQALIIANATYEAKLKANPEWKDSPDKKKKIRGQAIQDARNQVGAKKQRIVISDKEWEAIQSGAITNNKLVQILNNTDTDALKERAMPRNTRTIRDSQVSRMKAMASSGYSIREIADQLGVSPSTVSKYI
jgi:DNA-binding CsgD family transcriptional regulator